MQNRRKNAAKITQSKKKYCQEKCTCWKKKKVTIDKLEYFDKKSGILPPSPDPRGSGFNIQPSQRRAPTNNQRTCTHMKRPLAVGQLQSKLSCHCCDKIRKVRQSHISGSLLGLLSWCTVLKSLMGEDGCTYGTCVMKVNSPMADASVVCQQSHFLDRDNSQKILKIVMPYYKAEPH